MKNSRLTSDLAQEEDKDKILDLNRLEYGVHDVLTTHTDFDWRYHQNPAGQAIVPVVRDDQNNVIGFVWVVPQRIRIKGHDHSGATGTNLVIHPEYRNSFAYVKLMRRFEQVFRERDIPLHFSFVSQEKYQRQQECNPEHTSTIPLLIKPLDFETLAETYFTRAWQGLIVSRIGQLVSPFLFRQQSTVSDVEITVQMVDQFDESFDDFWIQVRDKYSVMIIRDRAFLAWRFAEVSGRHYRILAARTQDQMLGYTVLRCETVRGVKMGLVMDLLVSDGTLGEMAGACLITEAEHYFRAQEMSLTTGLMPSFTAEYQILRRAGYLPLPQILGPRVFWFAFVLHTNEKDLISLSVQDWFVTIADYESL